MLVIAWMLSGCFPTRHGLVVFPLGGLWEGTTSVDDEPAVHQASERMRERENAQIVETGRRMRRERAVEATRSHRTCEATAEPLDGARDQDVPERLDLETIWSSVEQVKPQVTSCRDLLPAGGRVSVFVTVAAGGCVDAVTVTSTPDPDLGRCVATAVHQATFAKTQKGGSFHYPFLL